MTSTELNAQLQAARDALALARSLRTQLLVQYDAAVIDVATSTDRLQYLESLTPDDPPPPVTVPVHNQAAETVGYTHADGFSGSIDAAVVAQIPPGEVNFNGEVNATLVEGCSYALVRYEDGVLIVI